MKAVSFVILSNIGNPTHPRTWSGTPSNLIAALQKKGYRATGVDLTFGRFARSALWRLYGKEYGRSRLSLLLSQLRLWLMGVDGEIVFLHISTTSFPVGKKKAGVRHVLFMDSTVHLESLYTISPLNDGQTKKREEDERRALTIADHVFTTSECARQDIVEH